MHSASRNVHRRSWNTPSWLPGVLCGAACGVMLIVGTTVVFGPPTAQPDTGASFLRNPATWAVQTLQMAPPLWRRNRRIVAVVIENHLDARPHLAGLERALLIEEYLVESGITRFVAFFDVDDLPERIGPVRSLRPYFVDAVRPWTTVILHAGGSPEAFEQADATEDLTAINALRYQFEQYFARDPDIAAPHNLFTDAEHVRALLEGREIPDVRWPPYPVGGLVSTSGATVIDMNYGSHQQNVRYTYHSADRRYGRESLDAPELHPRNLVVLEIPIEGIGEIGRLDMPITGSGNALLFREGMVTRARWEKAEGNSPLSFYDQAGYPLALATGQTWIAELTDLRKVTWQ